MPPVASFRAYRRPGPDPATARTLAPAADAMSANPPAQPRPTGDIRPISGRLGTGSPEVHDRLHPHISHSVPALIGQDHGPPQATSRSGNGSAEPHASPSGLPPGLSPGSRAAARTNSRPNLPRERARGCVSTGCLMTPRAGHAGHPGTDSRPARRRFRRAARGGAGVQSGRHGSPPGPVHRLRGMRRRFPPARSVQRDGPTHAAPMQALPYGPGQSARPGARPHARSAAEGPERDLHKGRPAPANHAPSDRPAPGQRLVRAEFRDADDGSAPARAPRARLPATPVRASPARRPRLLGTPPAPPRPAPLPAPPRRPVRAPPAALRARPRAPLPRLVPGRFPRCARRTTPLLHLPPHSLRPAFTSPPPAAHHVRPARSSHLRSPPVRRCPPSPDALGSRRRRAGNNPAIRTSAP